MYSIYIVFNYPIHYKKLQMSVVLCLIKLKMYIISYKIVSKKKKKQQYVLVNKFSFYWTLID